MAGSGKTTLVQRVNAHLHASNTPAYLINLDPAVGSLPYAANVDIRDTASAEQRSAALSRDWQLIFEAAAAAVAAAAVTVTRLCATAVA